jgi:ankyrin repeat protein
MKRWMIAALPAAALALAASHVQAGPKDDQLLAAVRNRDHAAIKALVASGANPNFRFADNSVALSWAVDRADVQGVQALLAAGADPNLKDLDTASPLVLACESGEVALIGQLLDAKADVNAKRFDAVTPMHICARTAPAAIVVRMLAAGGQANGANVDGQTPLMFAAAGDRIENFAPLIQAGAKVDATSRKGFSPLFFAVKSGSPKAVKALLDAGAPAQYAAADGTTALQLALYDKRVDTASLLIDAGAKLSGWDEIGRQPLQAAIAVGDVGLVKLMLAKGADPNGLSRLPYRLDPTMDNSPTGVNTRPRARDYAAIGYTPKIMLNKYEGAGPVAEPAEPATPLIIAAQKGADEIMKVLVAGGAKRDFSTVDGNNVLLAAAGSGKLAAVQYALEIYPNVDTVTQDGSSVMHVALANSRAPETAAIVRYLVDKGAPLNLRNKRGQTPSAVAVRGLPAIRDLYAELLKARNVPAEPPEQRAAAS